MKPKSEKDYRKLGFRYESEQEFKREFALAKAFFELFPDEPKIGRNTWNRINWNVALYILSIKNPELVPDLTEALASPPKHSYINQINAENPSERIISALGNKIASGSYGRVKNSIDEYGHHTATKIEKTNSKKQIKETEINRDQGLLRSEKMSRKGGKNNIQDKYYTSFPFLGQDLLDRFTHNEFKLFEKILKVARKSAWELHRIHTGDNQSKTSYAHCDIKPENIMLGGNGHVEIVDYGMAKKLDEPIMFEGTRNYLPTDFPEHLKTNKLVVKKTWENMQELGLIGTDIAAFKKTFAAIFNSLHNFYYLSANLKNILGTREYQLLNRKNLDTMLSITMEFLEQELRVTPGTFSTLNTNAQQLIGDIFAQIDKIEESSFEEIDQLQMSSLALSLKYNVLRYPPTETSLADYLQYVKSVWQEYEIHKTNRQISIQTNNSSSETSLGNITLFKTDSKLVEDDDDKKQTLNKETRSKLSKN